MTQGFVNPYTYAVSAPTVTALTSGSGTYTVPAGVQFLIVNMVGGGGGGGGSGTTTPGTGTTGGTTSFGTASATGGVGGLSGGSGGVGSGGTLNLVGAQGSWGAGNSTAGGSGGNTQFGGSGAGGNNAPGAGNNAQANSGSGGGGAGGGATVQGSYGGGAGGFVQRVITSPSATYSYSIGSGGTGGAAGTSGAAGGNGGSGVIYVYEYYQTLGIPTTLTLPLPISNGGTGTSVAPSTFYVNTANTSIGSIAIVKYSNVVNDSASAYSASTGLYTIPTTGWYTVNANIKTTSYNFGASAIIQIDIRQNSTVIAQQIITPTAYNSTSLSLNAGTVYKFTAGDTVSVYGFSNLGGGGGTTLDNSVTNFLSINFLHS